MAYLRAKRINGKQYFYLVESVRVGSKVRQRVVKYIGAVEHIEEAVKRSHGKKRE